MISVGEILNRLEGHQPEIDPRASPHRAEVALVLDGSAADHDPSIIFIQRSPSPDDPWSGQMAFPGGRREDSDLEAGDAARRETREEIGLELRPAQPVGRLGDLQGRHGFQEKCLRAEFGDIKGDFEADVSRDSKVVKVFKRFDSSPSGAIDKDAIDARGPVVRFHSFEGSVFSVGFPGLSLGFVEAQDGSNVNPSPRVNRFRYDWAFLGISV